MNFDMTEFLPEGWTIEDSTFRDGMIYVPNDCNDEQSNCNIHFAFHGCQKARKMAVGNGYNEMAAQNKIIMIYPDAKCWG